MDFARSTDDRGEVTEDRLSQGTVAQTAYVYLWRTIMNSQDLVLLTALYYDTLGLNQTEMY